MRLLATCFTAVVMAAAATTTAAAVETGHQPHSASSAAAAVAAAAAGPPFAYGVGPSLHYNSADKVREAFSTQCFCSNPCSFAWL
jgi:hypothetical protein